MYICIAGTKNKGRSQRTLQARVRCAFEREAVREGESDTQKSK